MSISVVCTSITLALQIDYYVSCKLNCNILKKYVALLVLSVRELALVSHPRNLQPIGLSAPTVSFRTA